MNIEHPNLFQKVTPVLLSKIEEFQHFGYDHITIEDLWNFCIKKKWRKKIIEELKVHEIVETIFSITASEIVSFTQIKAFKENDWFEDLNKNDLNDLFRKELKKE